MSGSKDVSGGVFRIDDERSLSADGIPNSRTDLCNNGKLIQSRWYGPDGKAVLNRDFEHQDAHKNHIFPHDHKWDWSKVPPRQEPEN
ncbi:MAG: hypothetical protein PHE93_05315 [Clostridia bacterium]|nr:hypothetical protein [Clostridia bacterium]